MHLSPASAIKLLRVVCPSPKRYGEWLLADFRKAVPVKAPSGYLVGNIDLLIDASARISCRDCLDRVKSARAEGAGKVPEGLDFLTEYSTRPAGQFYWFERAWNKKPCPEHAAYPADKRKRFAIIRAQRWNRWDTSNILADRLPEMKALVPAEYVLLVPKVMPAALHELVTDYAKVVEP